MASNALDAWTKTQSPRLDQIVAAHGALEGKSPGRRYATAQVVHAYAVLLSGHFQRFCRDLHSEASDHISYGTTPQAAADILSQLLTQGRMLDRGNPNPGGLGADFGRFGVVWWDAVRAKDARNDKRKGPAHQVPATTIAQDGRSFPPLNGTRGVALALLNGRKPGAASEGGVV